MTETLFDATLQLARAIGVIRTGTADAAGTTSTLIDSNRPESSDDWNGGTLWHIDDSEFSEITDFDATTGTFTLLDDLTAATVGGDRYAVASAKYPLDWIIDAINQELTMMRYPVVDTSSITISSGQSEYTLPAAVHDLRQVYYQHHDDADDNQWVKINFDVEKSATGSANKLLLPSYGLNSGNDIKLVYITRHSAIYNDSDQIDESIKLERIVPQAIVNLLLRYMEDQNTEDRTIGQRINYWDNRAREMKLEYPMRLPARQGKFLMLGNDDVILHESSDDA